MQLRVRDPDPLPALTGAHQGCVHELQSAPFTEETRDDPGPPAFFLEAPLERLSGIDRLRRERYDVSTKISYGLGLCNSLGEKEKKVERRRSRGRVWRQRGPLPYHLSMRCREPNREQGGCGS